MAVYNGYYTKEPITSTNNNINLPNLYSSNNGAVLSFAKEYNIYAPGGQMLSYTLDKDVKGAYPKTFKVLDMLGNTQITMKGNQIVGRYMYMPFGKQITLYESNSKDRMSFISKEKDIESELGDFGLRKYDYEIGRFTSIDPLWEKYYSWTPYHYCSNNPVMASDPSGKNGVKIVDTENRVVTVKAVYVYDASYYNSSVISDINSFLN